MGNILFIDLVFIIIIIDLAISIIFEANILFAEKMFPDFAQAKTNFFDQLQFMIRKR